MGWVWRDGVEDTNSIFRDVSEYQGPPDRCSIRRIVKSHCKTEEVEPGKFISKSEKTEEILRDCVAKPVEMVESNKEYTEDDVTEEVRKGSSYSGFSDHAVFDFPRLQSDVVAIGRSFLGNIKRFFHAAEEMKKGFFDVFDDAPYAEREFPSSSRRSGIPIEDHRLKESFPRSGEHKSSVDFSGMAKEMFSTCSGCEILPKHDPLQGELCKNKKRTSFKSFIIGKFHINKHNKRQPGESQ